MKYIISCLLFLFFVSSCGKKKAAKQAKTDEAIIVKYIADHHLTATRTDTGLYYVVDVIGGGIHPNSNSQVRVSYKGYFTDGQVFDQSDAAGIIFGLNSVIKGWTEGIPYFKAGGSGKLLIPSVLGYGASGNSGIPANSVLVFDIGLIEVY